MNISISKKGISALLASALLTLAAPVTTLANVKNPGLLVHAADDEATTLDPAQVEPGEGGETIILQVYDRLLDIDPYSPNLVPSLASVIGICRHDFHIRAYPRRLASFVTFSESENSGSGGGCI